MDMPRYLTKSRFKLALECPTKLYYTGKKEYPDIKLEDTFLAALAEGGYQVGELAKCYFPGGTEIRELGYDTALEQTDELLKLEQVVIYEAAFRFENLFIRADIVVKQGKKLSLYEVKAKSFDSTTDRLTNRNGIVSKWKPYVYDVAFQKYVIQSARPDLEVVGYLMLADKGTTASVDGLNQLFQIGEDERGRTLIKITGDTSAAALGDQILCTVNVDDICTGLFQEQPFLAGDPKTFKQWIHYYADHYRAGDRLPGQLTGKCGKCEFQATLQQEGEGLLSGFKECWTKEAGFTAEHFNRPHILDLWDYRRKDAMFAEKRYFLSELQRGDLEAERVTPHLDPWLSRVDRQWLQIEKAIQETPEIYIDQDGLREVFQSLKFPLHFIDFETSAVAIPFNKGRRPYEEVAFQFSHHVVYEDGRVVHQSEWLHDQRGEFPNFEFVRQLKASLEGDNGSILRYSNHENKILARIYEQLRVSSEPDKQQLCEWIQTVTHSTSSSTERWTGERDMVDLWDWVKKYYYAPETKGSNSIKAVLPAVINNSEFLKAKYSQPVYGTAALPSLNFTNKIWFQQDETGRIISPYKQLEPVFVDIDQDLLDEFVMEEGAEIADGGAAMMAYARMQFGDMTDAEREQIRASLLRYCELDTLAMVMIWEAWKADLG